MPTAARVLFAKGVSLLPDYQRALHAFAQDKNVQPMRDFLDRVLRVVYPNDQTPSWVLALSSQRRNAWRALVRSVRVLQGTLAHLAAEPNDWVWGSVERDLVALGKPLRALEIMSAVADEEGSFRHGPFRVFTVPGVTRAETAASLEALDEAAGKIRPRFPQVLYGDVYLATTLARSGPYTPSATYTPNNDTVQLSVRARRRFDDVYTIVHELGHRFDYKFVKDTPLYREFVALSTHKVWQTVRYDARLRAQVAQELVQAAVDRRDGRSFRPLSPEAELWAKQPEVDVKPLMSAFLAGKLDEEGLRARLTGREDVERSTGKLLHGPLAVTPYGATKVGENFAEAFAHYVLGMEMPAELQALLAQM